MAKGAEVSAEKVVKAIRRNPGGFTPPNVDRGAKVTRGGVSGPAPN